MSKFTGLQYLPTKSKKGKSKEEIREYRKKHWKIREERMKERKKGVVVPMLWYGKFDDDNSVSFQKYKSSVNRETYRYKFWEQK